MFSRYLWKEHTFALSTLLRFEAGGVRFCVLETKGVRTLLHFETGGVYTLLRSETRAQFCVLKYLIGGLDACVVVFRHLV